MPPSETLGAQRTLVTLLNFSNDLSRPDTPAEVTNVLSWRGWIRQLDEVLRVALCEPALHQGLLASPKGAGRSCA